MPGNINHVAWMTIPTREISGRVFKCRYRCLNPLDLQHSAAHLTITVHSTRTVAGTMAIFQERKTFHASNSLIPVSVTFVFDRSHTPYYAPTNDGPSVIMRRRLSRRARGFCLFTKQHLPRHHQGEVRISYIGNLWVGSQAPHRTSEVVAVQCRIPQCGIVLFASSDSIVGFCSC